MAVSSENPVLSLHIYVCTNIFRYCYDAPKDFILFIFIFPVLALHLYDVS